MVTTRSDDPAELPEPDGPALLASLAVAFRGQGFTAEVTSGLLRVVDGPDSRGVRLDCRRRAGDWDRWWFTWAGGIWLCEADKPFEAITTVKGALRRAGDPRTCEELAAAEVRAEFPDWTITDTETEGGRRWWASRGAPTSTILNRGSDLSASSPEGLRSKLRAHR
ncbi:hypothetical protein [Actinomadura xylanilytica]|uniref:hypothetical protein n=1 Tax=Actinomadura xylanilytica TaxID=887459 RepID=UPI00255A76BC|nr:hypothetical protein [Actinomadura xylanilytica]MDL4777393.1 hypothetical protein [Actinomadura xylanilytica]